MILIKHAEVYSPEYLGKKDVLICAGKVEYVDDNIDLSCERVQKVDGTEKILVPGFIDQHVHITGGGGEGGFKTRAPEVKLSELISGGITTVVGLLGTDAETRSVESLVSKGKALKEEGISVLLLTGSYEYPSVTLTGSVRKDIVFIDEITGCKLAVSDHRSSSITIEELQRLASDVRAAAMISGKQGVLTCHMGDGKKGLKPIVEAIEDSDIPIKIFRPTHVNRNKRLLEEGFKFAKDGGYIDLTCGIYEELSPRKVIKDAEDKGINCENITISSDGQGSWSKFDEHGNLVDIGVSSVKALHEEFRAMVLEENISIDKSLKYLTSNVSKALGIYPKKGCILEGSDADLLMLDEDLNISTVIAKGKVMIENKEIKVYGTYEK